MTRDDASLTFLVSLLGPSLCSPEAPAAEDDDPEAAVAAAAEPEADITLILLCLSAVYSAVPAVDADRFFPADFFLPIRTDSNLRF